MKVLGILLSSRGVDGRGGFPPRQSSLVLLGIRCDVGGAKVNLKFEPEPV